MYLGIEFTELYRSLKLNAIVLCYRPLAGALSDMHENVQAQRKANLFKYALIFVAEFDALLEW